MKVIKGIFSGFRIFIDVLLLAVIILCGYAGYYVYNSEYPNDIKKLYEQAKEIVSNASPEDFTHSETGTSYYDADGNTILMSYGGRYLEYDEIPNKAVDAIVAIEDERFFTHKGIDLKGIARAAYAIYKANGRPVQGGSTITQQLLKLKYLNTKQTYERKIVEAFASMLFEEKFTKEDIMEYYLNTIYFSNGYYGIDAAAYGYFNKDTTQLSTAQLAFILAIPNSPTRYDPYEHPENTKERQERILKAMYNQDYIDANEYKKAVAENIVLVEKNSKTTLVDNTKDYPFAYIQREAIRAIMQSNGFEFQYYFKSKKAKEAYETEYESAYDKAKQELARGYVVHTSISKKSQDALQKSVDKFMDGIDKKKTDEDVYVYQASGTCINNKTGLVEAIVGGRTDGSFLNRAYQSYRQPGSTIKPLIVYAPAIELKGYTANSIVNDHALKDGCKNANGRYIGNITLRNAVSYSINTIAWQLFDQVGPKTGLSYIKKMHFAKIVDEDNQLASGIGGLTYGTNTLEMASGYATLYNDGEYRTSTCITSIYDSTGQVIYSYDKNAEVKQVYKKSAAKEMVDIMTSVFDGTARGLKVDGFCAGKTGTTNESKDSWFCAMTDKYSTAIWVGKDDGTTMGHGVSGAAYAGHIWHDFMKKVNK